MALPDRRKHRGAQTWRVPAPYLARQEIPSNRRRPGPKHARRLFLEAWQRELAERWPEELIRGLIQSDGCRFMNTGRGGWAHPRYAFCNVSSDITSIFCSACDRLGLRWTAAFPKDESAAISIYVSRKADVASLDALVGPKH